MNSTQNTLEVQATLRSETPEIDLEAILAELLEDPANSTAEEQAEQDRRSAEALDSFLDELADDDGKAPIVPAPKTPTTDELEAQKLERVRRNRIETERRMNEAKMGFRPTPAPAPTTPPQVEVGQPVAEVVIEDLPEEAPSSEPPRAASVTVAPPDGFQIDEALLAEYRTQDDAALVQTLVELKGRQVPFCDVLPVFIAVGLTMNERGLLAPAYRPRRPLPRWGAEATPEDTARLRALQVIDLHWLWCRGKRDEIDDRRWATLFAGTDFDFDLAWRLACDKHDRPAAKAEALNLSTLEQLQLAILKGDEAGAMVRRMQKAEPSAKRRLHTHELADPSIGRFIPQWLELWRADNVLKGLSVRSAAIGQLHGWMVGRPPLNDRNLRKGLATMRERTASKARR